MSVAATQQHKIEAQSRNHPRLVLLTASLAVLLAQIDTSVVNLALKSIGGELRAGVSQMQWVIDAYNLVYACLLLTAGTLGDLYGHRRMFILGVALFSAGTLTCSLAPDVTILIAGRVISGFGAAFAVPMSLVLLTVAYPRREERAHAMGIWASCNGLAFIIGPTLGGWLLNSIGWRSIFYLALPVCAVTLALTYYAVRESSAPQGRKLDIPGQGLGIAGLGAFAFAAIEGSHWGFLSAPIIAIACVAIVALVLFVWVESRTSGPLLPISFLRRPVFSAALASAGLMTFGMYALLFIMPLYFQIMRGASPLVAGLELLPMSASFVIISQLVGYATNAFGPRIVMTTGMACMGMGEIALAFIGADTNIALVSLALFVVGIGLGLNTAPVNGVAVAALPPERSGTASGVLNTARMVGATLGVAILGAVFATYAGQQPTGPGFLSGLGAALGAGGVAELIGAVVTFSLIGHDSLKAKS